MPIGAGSVTQRVALGESFIEKSQAALPTSPPRQRNSISIPDIGDLPAELRETSIEFAGERYYIGYNAQEFVAHPSVANGHSLLAAAIILQFDIAGAAEFPNADYDPLKSDADNGFQPVQSDELVIGAKARRYRFTRDEFPLFAMLHDRRSEYRELLDKSTQNEIVQFAAATVALLQSK